MRRRWAAVGAVAAFAVLLGGGSVAAQGACTLTVRPAVAQAGTVFILRGRGFTPSVLELTKEGGTPTTVALNLGTSDPFRIEIASKLGDEGEWTATVTEPGMCSASVSFVATLRSTDQLTGPTDDLTGGRLPTGILLLLSAAGIAGGLLIAVRRAPWKMRT